MPLGILNNIPSLAAENELTLTSTRPESHTGTVVFRLSN